MSRPAHLPGVTPPHRLPSPAAANAREAARHTDGTFGALPRAEASVVLDLPSPDQALAGADAMPSRTDDPATWLDADARTRARSAAAAIAAARAEGDHEREGAAEARLEAAARTQALLDRTVTFSPDPLDAATRRLAALDPAQWPHRSGAPDLTAREAAFARDECYRRAVNAAVNLRANEHRFAEKNLPGHPYDIGPRWERGWCQAEVSAYAYWAAAIDAGTTPADATVLRVVADAHAWADGPFLQPQPFGHDRTTEWAEAVATPEDPAAYWISPIESRYPR